MQFSGSRLYQNDHWRAESSIRDNINCSAAKYIKIFHKIYQNISKYFKIYQNISKHIKTYQNISKHIKIYQNLSKHIKTYHKTYQNIPQNISKHIKITISAWTAPSGTIKLQTQRNASVSYLWIIAPDNPWEIHDARYPALYSWWNMHLQCRFCTNFWNIRTLVWDNFM